MNGNKFNIYDIFSVSSGNTHVKYPIQNLIENSNSIIKYQFDYLEMTNHLLDKPRRFSFPKLRYRLTVIIFTAIFGNKFIGAGC